MKLVRSGRSLGPHHSSHSSIELELLPRHSLKYGMGRAVMVSPRARVNCESWTKLTGRYRCLVIGIQHHILAQLFLVQFDPGVPKVGTTRRTAMKRMTVSIPRTWILESYWLTFLSNELRDSRENCVALGFAIGGHHRLCSPPVWGLLCVRSRPACPPRNVLS